jgi:hypothetical protein
VVEKFRKLTSEKLSSERQADVIALCERLDTLDDISALMAPLQV